jgi:hypothetical protein
LSGCANVYDKSAKAPACGRGADQSIALQVSGPGFAISGGFVIPGRNLGGSGKLDAEWGMPRCIQEENKTKPPKLYDWRKIGMAL